MKNAFLSLLLLGLLLVGCKSSTDELFVRLNQVGFAPKSEKTATIDVLDMTTSPLSVAVISAQGEEIWSGKASATMPNPISGKPRQIVDFSEVDAEGKFFLLVEGFDDKVPFSISAQPYRELARSAVRAYYFQRASMPIEEPYAEGWAREAGHPDSHVLVHPSAATEARPEGTVLSCPGGWYDAGDYNKYIVNSGYTVGVMLMAYEALEPFFNELALNIPESANQVPDVLDEAMYNIRWMLTMQDLDGGVYHKLTEPGFEGFIAPKDCKKQRYVVMKTTAATLDFASTMALAARVYAPYKEEFPGFVEEATVAAEKAFAWAEKNPEIYYFQDKMNKQFSPAVTTGAYPDTNVTDEFYWAASELYFLTGKEEYMQKAMASRPAAFTPATWGDVAELASLDWLMHGESADADMLQSCLGDLKMHLAPYLAEAESVSVHRSPYGNRAEDFFWGCNSEGCAWRGVECLYAYKLTGDHNYLLNAERCLSFLLGQNATGYCYVTGFGTKPTQHPHQRITVCYDKALPGFLAGGPNPGQQDRNEGMTYPKGIQPDECYLDVRGSYASNEIAINWNVTLATLAAGVEYFRSPAR